MKNKVYMEKLPKNCFECPCFRNDIEQCCTLDDEDEHFFLDEIDGGNCPLIKVSDTKMYQEGYLQRKFDEEADKILKEKKMLDGFEVKEEYNLLNQYNMTPYQLNLYITGLKKYQKRWEKLKDFLESKMYMISNEDLCNFGTAYELTLDKMQELEER